MNKKQLVVLWCVALLILTTLADGWGILALKRNTSAQLSIGVIILGALLVYTFKHNQDNKFLIKLAGGAIAFVFAIAGFNYYKNVLSIVDLPQSEIAKIHLEKSPAHYDNGSIFAEVYNGSSYTLSTIRVKISAYQRWEPPEVKKQSKDESSDGWEAAPSSPYAKYAPKGKPSDNNGKTTFAQDIEKLKRSKQSVWDEYDAVSQADSKLLWERDYEDSMHLAPLKTEIFHVKATDTTNVTLTYKIVEVRGRKEN